VSEREPVAALLDEAESHPIVGWDFSWLEERISTAALPWDYERRLLDHARGSPDLLDMGTGGGERLARLPHRPPRTVATESWPPNVETASARLRPLGITVVATEAAPDNVDQEPEEQRGRLPFPSASFSLIANRHESFVASEVARVLAPGGIFVTQQMGGDYGEFYDALELPRPPARAFDLARARAQVEDAGLRVLDCDEAAAVTTFRDVGAFAWYLKAIPWVVEGFSVTGYEERLRRLHGSPITIRQPAFWLEAVKPKP
jgi:SAM-dependent methyltransferase